MIFCVNFKNFLMNFWVKIIFKRFPMNFRVLNIFLNFQVVKLDSKMFYFYLFSKPVLKILKHIARCRGTINTFHEYKLYYVENTLPRVLFINNNNKDTSIFHSQTSQSCISLKPWLFKTHILQMNMYESV